MTEEKTNLPDAMKTFQERVLNKVRSDIADMLPEDAIKAMFDKALESVFFEGTPAIRDGYGNVRQAPAPSWFVQEVAKQAEPIAKAYVEKHMEQFKPTIEKAIVDFLKAENLMMIAVGTMTQVADRNMMEHLDQLAGRIATHIRQGY